MKMFSFAQRQQQQHLLFPILLLLITIINICTSTNNDNDNVPSEEEMHTYIYPSNCIDLEDGIYRLQLIDDSDYPAVNVRCSNGYIILDFNLDNEITNYFSTWELWHRATAGPSNDERINWQQWYLPDSGVNSHNYLVSPDCTSCEYVSNRQLYDSDTTYWMTGQFFGCYWRVKANENCDMDYNSLECYTCDTDDRYINDVTSEEISYKIGDDSSEEEYANTGLCTHNIRQSNHYVAVTQEMCTTSRTDLIQGSQNLKPSIGTNGEYCVCTQANNIDHTEYYTIEREIKTEEKYIEYINNNKNNKISSKTTETDMLKTESKKDKEKKENIKIRSQKNHQLFERFIKTYMKSEETETETEEGEETGSSNEKTVENLNDEMSNRQNSLNNGIDDAMLEILFETDNYVELTQTDFISGTYRIKESGYYKIMEDILFDFNPSNLPATEADSYWPLKEQADEYPGAQDFRDEYSFGFFAGITVEADDVIIDLNGKLLSMSEYFYLQQAWFTIIELSQQYFLPGQSFGFFGANPHFSNNVLIMNGGLGLSSHHGIHGNSNKNIFIKNVQIKEFNTHGIQLNGFENVILKDVEIGPSSTKNYFHGQWGVARVLERRWQHIAEESYGETITFKHRNNEGVTMQDIVDELKTTMRYGWNYVTNTFDIKNDGYKSPPTVEENVLRSNAQRIENGDYYNVETYDINDKASKNNNDNNNGFRLNIAKDIFGETDSEEEDAKDGIEIEENEFEASLTSDELETLSNAKDLFINPSGLPSAASIYGIFLNKFGASVFTYNLYSKQYSSTAILDGIQVHGLKHEMQEWPYLIGLSYDDVLGTSTDEIKNPFFGPLSASSLFNEYPDFEYGYPTYKGNIITDGYIASTYFLAESTNSFKYLGQQCVLNDLIASWATVNDGVPESELDRFVKAHKMMEPEITDDNDNNDNNEINNKVDGDDDDNDNSDDVRYKNNPTILNNFIQIGCNMDVMNHAGKGLLGIRVDSVDFVVFKDISIYDNHDSTGLGTNGCGDYETEYTNVDGFIIKKTGHFKQTEPMQVGFSGNMNQGIAISASKNIQFEGKINIFDLTSETGQVYGIAVWPNVDVTVNNAEINIKNLESGGIIDMNSYDYEEKPNSAPEVCAIRLYEEYSDFTSSISIIKNEAESNILAKYEFSCMAGDVGCFGEKDKFSYSGLEKYGGSGGIDVINHDECNFRFSNSAERVKTRKLELMGNEHNNNNNNEKINIDKSNSKSDNDIKENEKETMVNMVENEHGNEIVNNNVNNVLSEENSNLSSFYKLKFIWNNDSSSNIVTEVLFAIVLATLCCCVGYLFIRFCCYKRICCPRKTKNSNNSYYNSNIHNNNNNNNNNNNQFEDSYDDNNTPNIVLYDGTRRVSPPATGATMRDNNVPRLSSAHYDYIDENNEDTDSDYKAI